jgi:purine-binding chemotaxis protein CheW
MSEILTKPTTLAFLTCQVQDSLLAFDLQKVQRILPLAAINPLPKSPPYVVGLLDFAGESVPIIHLGMLLDMPNVQPLTVSASIVLCQHDDKLLGMVVDTIEGLQTVNVSNIKKNSTEKSVYFSGQMIVDAHILLLLNVPSIFHVSEEL